MTFNLTVDLKAKKLALRSRHRFTGRPWPLFFPDLFGVVAPNCSSAGNLVVSGPWACPSVGRGPSKPRCCRTAGSEEVSSEHQAVWGEGEVHRRIGRLPRRHVATERMALRDEHPIANSSGSGPLSLRQRTQPGRCWCINSRCTAAVATFAGSTDLTDCRAAYILKPAGSIIIRLFYFGPGRLPGVFKANTPIRGPTAPLGAG